MANRQLIKYDVVLSFTEKDEHIASALHKELKKKCLKVYYYKVENQIGQDLMRTIKRVYGNTANNAVVILSDHYTRKRWTNVEWRVLNKAKKRYKVKNIFLVRIDQSTMPGMRGTEIYEKWNNNPREIATKIKKKIGGQNTCRIKLIIGLSVLFLIGALIYVLFELGYI